MERWPNFFIVGAPKAGTTSLYNYLNDVPGIFMSPVKEPRYFINDQLEASKFRRIEVRDKSEYLKLFDKATNEKAIGEATTGYLRCVECPKRIHDQIPNARIIISLRDPVTRTFSHYLMQKCASIEKRTFHDMITETLAERENGIHKYNMCLDLGLYAEQVKRYLDVFRADKVLILIFEEFVKKPKATIKKVLEFLEIDEEPPDSVGQVHNPAGLSRIKGYQKIRRSKLMKKINKEIPSSMRIQIRDTLFFKKQKSEFPEEERSTLENYFREDVKQLQIILKQKMPWDWIE